MHCIGAGHSFVDVAQRAGTTAQRVRIGLTGLAFAFLLVLLGSIVSRSGQDDNAVMTANSESDAPKEPLAELGVAPGSSASEADENQTSENK